MWKIAVLVLEKDWMGFVGGLAGLAWGLGLVVREVKGIVWG